ncbi:hypothetical protein ABZU75_10970 [Streptosporangium sp. NPDC005286]|uniref:ATP-grasp domain-containing protein n=1 Tax=Streptosporangium sp. NPDC005286 TaxID=3154463 RepID=UPI0033B0C555
MPLTTKVAYVHLGQTHDEFPEVAEALEERGVSAVPVHLDDMDSTDWASFDLVNLRMCRGFQKHDDFAERVSGLGRHIEKISGPGVLVNPSTLIPSGYDKSVYIPMLESAGIATVPTRWLQRGTPGSLTDVMAAEGWEDVVVKPAVSSRSWRTFRASTGKVADRRGEDHHLLPDDGKAELLFEELLAERTIGVQPFLPGILSAGETSYIFLGGGFSHAVHKRVADDGWFAHELFGGTIVAVTPKRAELDWAAHVVNTLTEHYGELLFARVDALPGDLGAPVLLECELVVPRLFLREGDGLSRYAAEVAARAGANRAARG